ncbi:hypothetical protein LIER_41447 [Lithospermum erythrorhizon]|uniref:Uncharacterized protein n=1 Tax=Lithospermum erythrorhizon TaxID=34254 RepID=A0AAV3RFA6_LITER
MTKLGLRRMLLQEEVSPIVKEKVIDSSVAEKSKVADVSNPSVKPSVEDTTSLEVPSTKGLGVNVNPSVGDKLNGLKDSTPSRGDVLRPSADDSVKDTVAEGPPPGAITISPKLMEGTHVVDIHLAPVDTGGALGSNTDGIA